MARALGVTPAAVVVLAVALGLAAGCRCGGRERPAQGADGAAAGDAGDRTDAAASAASAPPREMAVLQAVEVADPIAPGGAEPVAIDTRELAELLGRMLVTSGVFTAREADVPPSHRARPAVVRVRISYSKLALRARRLAVGAAVEARIAWTDGGDDPAPGDNVLAERQLELTGGGAAGARTGPDPDDVVRAHVADTLQRAGRGLIEKERIRTGPVAELRAALTAPIPAAPDPAGSPGRGRDGDRGAAGKARADSTGGADAESAEAATAAADAASRKLWALELVAHRAQAEVFDAVVAALASDHVDIRNQALTALVAIGDPRAVDALTRRAEFSDIAFLHMVIEATAALGGPEAREYLEFVASGHESRQVRERAAQALERIARRDPGADPPLPSRE